MSESVAPHLDFDVHEVGARLRQLRQDRSVTLRQLADQLGVSVSALSQIERGRLRPSVARLYQIVTALDTSLDSVFRAPDRNDTPVRTDVTSAPGRATPRALFQAAESRPVIELEQGITWTRISPQSYDGAAEMLEVCYPPGSVSTLRGEYLRHSGHEVGYVTAGCLVVEVAFERFELTVGASLFIDSSVPHRVSNMSVSPATAIWFTFHNARPPIGIR